jgi:hypothetical protein
MHGREDECIKKLAESSRGMSPLGRPQRRWVGNIRKDFKEIVAAELILDRVH